MTGITLLQSGPFLTPTFKGKDPSGTNPSGRRRRKLPASGLRGWSESETSNPTRDQWFNPAAFTVPGKDIGRFGNCGVGILHGYEAQISNLFDLVNYDSPITRITAGNFGHVTATQPGEQAGPRTIQMTLRFMFQGRDHPIGRKRGEVFSEHLPIILGSNAKSPT